jgi:hypothetical protein
MCPGQQVCRHETENYAERSSASATTHTCRGDIRPVPPPGLEPLIDEQSSAALQRDVGLAKWQPPAPLGDRFDLETY